MRADRFFLAVALAAMLAGAAPAMAQSSEQRVTQAREAVVDARRTLQSAYDNSGPDDWITVRGADGRGARRIPAPHYAARVEALEAVIKRAEAELEEAKRAAL